MADSPQDNDAARIRAKRMAKLAGAGAATGAQSSTSSGVPPQSNAAEAETSTDGQDGTSPQSAAPPAASSPKPATSTTPNPFAKLGLKPEQQQQQQQQQQQTQTAPRSQINITPLKREADASTRPRSRQGRQDTPEEWEDRVLGNIFRVTLRQDQTSDSQGRLYYLSGLKSDLEDSEAPVRLTVANLDSALIEAASNFANKKPLDYLLGCWKRVIKAGRSLRSPATEPWKVQVIKEARRQCMSYCLFAASTPEMFDVEGDGLEMLADRMVDNPDGETGTCFDFFQEAATRVQEDEDARNVLVGAMVECSRRLAKISMDGDYRSYMMALRNFIVHPPLCDALTKHDSFLPDGIQPQDIETQSFLGPFFRLSPLQAEVAKSYFAAAISQPENVVRNTQNSSRLALKTHQDELSDIVNVIVKTGEGPRKKLLDWFALTVNANHKRRAMQVDHKTVSSDAIMVNVTTILDRLFEPAMDATFTKVDKIDVNYLRRSPRVNIQDETKINADQKTSDDFYSHRMQGENRFIPEVFFLTVAAHHYGTEAANSQLQNKERTIRHLEKEIVKMEADRPRFVQNPAQLLMFDRAVKKYKDQLNQSKCEVQATRGILLDETTQGRSMQLMRYVIVWLLRIASGKNLPTEQLELPLPAAQNEVFACLPEYLMEDVVENFKFISRYMPWIITSTQCEELVDFCITFLRNSEYIKNPYLKSGLVTILFHGVYPVPNRAKGVLGDTLNASPFAYKHLLHALMKFYIEAESTGTHNQFYDKFNIRYEIFQVIRCIWSNTVYRDNLATEARVNTEFFVRFVNLLLNDVTYVLDESFTAFRQIHDLTDELRNAAADMDANVKQEKEEALSTAKDKAKSYMQLTNETVSMLKLFTEALADSFTKQEIVQRLADMLDYNLDALTGPKQRDLKVENSQEYNWRPQEMLSDIMDVYLNLREKTNFHLAVARDGRSYRPANFTTAAKVMGRFALKSPEQLRQWEVLGQKIAKAKEDDEQAEEDLGEIPDEFLDPLLATLMEDPIVLPKSKITVDRSTIRSHLLSDPTDPFNRQPMTIEEVKPDEELKGKIDAWRAERAAEKKNEKLAETAGGEPMDTT